MFFIFDAETFLAVAVDYRSASEAEFYAKPQWQQPSPSLEAVKATSGCAQRVSTTPKHTEAVASGPNFLATATADSQRAPSPVNVSTAATTPGDVIAVKEVHDVSTESSLAVRFSCAFRFLRTLKECPVLFSPKSCS